MCSSTCEHDFRPLGPYIIITQNKEVETFMPRGVKKTQEAEAASENNVTVEGETKEAKSTSKSVTVEMSEVSEIESKTDSTSKSVKEKVSEKKSEKQKQSKSQDTEPEVSDRFYYIERPVPLYLAKNTASPLLGMVSGKCRIRSEEGSWVKITIGVAEKGSTTGYIMRNQAIIK